ncbi:hypothetical protein ASPACDRAFT_113626 [Aspergillus aculeatus ATCC 16872]|uniref:FAD-binding domain-containing protein n=1 Tax=Aspergillus aculeatus (strain ATCC 16872 / CBS 172.66 / WB 5094) TaxID=690307 RepID=A0A1L9X3H2_ASPA1|nr:uncharacterized protein ASPACDRAFT_113626 [Aspergillus aculeatus ATCC 16872]OJK03022.1 hypothetical protein ASPACDRAFT_113626 [Aspergillus aculeatus ATCC 16872]
MSLRTKALSATPPVIIVGASLVGLSAALSLATRGIPTITLERHEQICPHPRALGFTSRTMEIYQSLGIAHQIPQAPADFKLLRAHVHTVFGKWHEQTTWNDPAKSDKDNSSASEENTAPIASRHPKREYSPFPGAAIPQDTLERILESTAIARGADIRRGYTALSATETPSGVEVTIRANSNEEGQATATIRGSYLIAADGSRSLIRSIHNIPRHGRGLIQTMRSVLFRSQTLSDLLATCEAKQFQIEQDSLKAFLTTYTDGRWVLMFYDDVDRSEIELLNAITQVLGRTDIPVEIIATGRWDLAGLVADRFRAGKRMFLAGDAAHTLPPNRGGYGANTGIGDVDNLAWKLDMVLRGQAGERLLDTYESERMPVAWLRHDQIFCRKDYKVQVAADQTQSGLNLAGKAGKEVLNDQAMEFGQVYVSKGIIGGLQGEGEEAIMAKRPEEWAGLPGTRVPHIWLETEAGEKIAIGEVVDGKGWSILAAQETWEEAVAEYNQKSQIQLQHVTIRDLDFFRTAFSVEESGAVLVRPDGFIAWRTTERPEQATQALEQILAQVNFTR